MIKAHMTAMRDLQANISALESTIASLPQDRLRYALEAELRILKRVANGYQEQSEELYDMMFDFAMKVPA